MSCDIAYSFHPSHFQYDLSYTKSTNSAHLINATTFIKQLNVTLLSESSTQTFTNYLSAKIAMLDSEAQSTRLCCILMNLPTRSYDPYKSSSKEHEQLNVAGLGLSNMTSASICISKELSGLMRL